MGKSAKLISLEKKIEKARENVEKQKEKYDAAKEALNDLLTKREEQQKADIITAIAASGRSFDEIMKYFSEKSQTINIPKKSLND